MKDIIFSCIILLGLCTCKSDTSNQQQQSQDQISSDPGETTLKIEESADLLFENKYAKVLKVILKPGQKQPEHYGSMRLIYPLNDYTIQWMEAGSDQGNKQWDQGEVHFHQAGLHAAQNIGSNSAQWLVFERKTDNLPQVDLRMEENDIASIPGNYASLLFENEFFKLMKVVIPPGTEVPEHSGINRIIYSLNDYTLDFQSEGEDITEKSLQEGQVHWHNSSRHALKNTGQTSAEYLVVAFK
ncbi:MAG: cupin domain-containing protein [Candidatus Cyclobacteriaceae bacterium M3_2C_046]